MKMYFNEKIGISSSPFGGDVKNHIVEVDKDHEVFNRPDFYKVVNGKLVRKDDKALLDSKLDKKQELKKVCENKIVEGFTASNGNVYRYNHDDQMNMITQYQELMFNDALQFIEWDTENIGTIEHTCDEWIQVYQEATRHKESCRNRYKDLKEYIDSLSREAEVEAVTWDTTII